MTEEMDINSGDVNICEGSSDCEMEQSPLNLETHVKKIAETEPKGMDVPDSRVVLNEKTKSLDIGIKSHFSEQSLSKQIIGVDRLVDQTIEETCEPCDTGTSSPPVFVNAEPFQRELSPPTTLFQKPSIYRTNSLGADDQSPFAIRRRPPKMSIVGQQGQSPSAFQTRRLCAQSPLRGSLFDDDENVLKRCNSAPMLNDISDTDVRVTWQHSSMTPGPVRARRFSATVLSVHASPSAGTSKSTSRLHQLKKEESLEGIQHKETAHEREVQTSIQMNHTCEELSLVDTTDETHNGLLSGAGDGGQARIPLTEVPRSPLPSSTPVNIPNINKHCPTRAIDFNLPLNGSNVSTPHHAHHTGGGGIPSPLTISPSSCLLCPSPLPPSPTRGLGLSSTGKQCFSPSMQAPVPICLRPGSLSPSPSPTRRTFVTRRRSQSPCIMKPSALGPIKRKYDSDSEGGGGCSPKRMFIQGANNIGQVVGPNGDSLAPYPVVMTPLFSRGTIHRSQSLSSSSVDSDINISPSPPQNGGNHQGFLPSAGNHLRENSTNSPFQSPIYNQFLGSGAVHLELGRCSSPASSTCSSSSLEGLKDLQPFSTNAQQQQTTSNIMNQLLVKPVPKDRPSLVSSASSTANVSL